MVKRWITKQSTSGHINGPEVLCNKATIRYAESLHELTPAGAHVLWEWVQVEWNKSPVCVAFLNIHTLGWPAMWKLVEFRPHPPFFFLKKIPILLC